MEDSDELTVAEIADTQGLNVSTVRAWVNSGRLPAHRDDANARRWLVYRRDLDAFLEKPTRGDALRPKGVMVETTSRDDWSDAPAEATLDLTSSLRLPELPR